MDKWVLNQPWLLAFKQDLGLKPEQEQVLHVLGLPTFLFYICFSYYLLLRTTHTEYCLPSPFASPPRELLITQTSVPHLKKPNNDSREAYIHSQVQRWRRQGEQTMALELATGSGRPIRRIRWIHLFDPLLSHPILYYTTIALGKDNFEQPENASGEWTGDNTSSVVRVIGPLCSGIRS